VMGGEVVYRVPLPHPRPPGQRPSDLARRPASGTGSLSRVSCTASAMSTATMNTQPGRHALLR
jgi:hypothetical protein